jgi:hypothetical protein
VFNKQRPSTALYVWDGKIPKSEMMKLTHRNGLQFSCGWEPPVMSLDMGGVPIWTSGPAVLNWPKSDGAATPLVGSAEGTPPPELHIIGWVWIGICCVVRVTDSVPPVSANWNVVPEKVPMWMGILL